MRSITVRRMMMGIAVLVVLLSILVPLAKRVGELQYRSKLSRRSSAMIMGLTSRCPPGINPATWEESVTWTQIIGVNLYDFGSNSTTAKERLNEDLSKRLRGSNGPEIIPWIWTRYARMVKGRGQEGYVRSYRRLALVPLLSDVLRSRRPLTIPPTSWNRAVEMTDTALASVIRRAPDSDPARLLAPEEADRIFDSMEEILVKGPDRGILLGVWDGLDRAGPFSKQYVEREKPALIEVLDGSAR